MVYERDTFMSPTSEPLMYLERENVVTDGS